MINTKCDQCIFKVLDNNNKQIACSFHIDDILINNYPDIYPSTTINKDNEYWVLENFKCVFGRTESWLKSYTDFFGRSDNITRYILEQLQIRYYAVLLCDGSFKEFTHTIDIISTTNNRPQFISVILPANKHDERKQYAEYLENSELPKWKLHSILDLEITDAEMLDVCISTNYESSNSDYLIVKYTSTVLTSDFYDRINELINFCVGKKVVVIPNSKENFDGLSIPLSLYKAYDNAIGIAYYDLLNDDSVYKIKFI
jgi:hypothetical protein